MQWPEWCGNSATPLGLFAYYDVGMTNERHTRNF